VEVRVLSWAPLNQEHTYNYKTSALTRGLLPKTSGTA
jgi:hypothetical protein